MPVSRKIIALYCSKECEQSVWEGVATQPIALMRQVSPLSDGS